MVVRWKSLILYTQPTSPQLHPQHQPHLIVIGQWTRGILQKTSGTSTLLSCGLSLQVKLVPWTCSLLRRLDEHLRDLGTLTGAPAQKCGGIDILCSFSYRYFVGVHNKKTGVTTIRQAPLHVLTQEVKALKGLEPAPVTVLQRPEARAFLGEAFGTKKAKLAISAQQQNKVDISTMGNVADHLQESIHKGTRALPSIGPFYFVLLTNLSSLRRSLEEAQATSDSTRLVPPYNADAHLPGNIYPVHNMIPETEWKSLSSATFLEAGLSHERISLLPFRRSKWINQHLNFICESPSPSKTNM